MNLNGVEYYYIRNAQGDIIGLFDKNGTQVVGYVYDSWGKLISTTGTLGATVGVKNPYRYRGYRYDSETGLYYLQSRYYNADWGRYINADATGGQLGTLLSHNMFAYCMNNPVNMEDPSGHWSIWAGIKNYIAPVLEIAAGAVMVGASIAAFGSGNIVVGAALLMYGANHIYSGYKDIENISNGNDADIGKDNLIRNTMKESYGEKAGNIIYGASDLGMSIITFKVPTPQKLAKVSSHTIINVKFSTVQNNITAFKGINGLKNMLTSGYNLRYDKVIITSNTVRGYIGKFIGIFNGGDK